MELKNINTSKFLFDPKKQGFEKDMLSKDKIFDIKEDRKKWLTYICLLYDPNSEIRRNVRDYIQRKHDCAFLSGFELNDQKIFDKEIEDRLISEDNKFNKVICKYAYYAFENDYKLLELLINKYDLEIDKKMESLGNLSDKDRKNLKGMKDDIEILVVKIFGGEETVKFKRIFYDDIDYKYLQLLVDNYTLEIETRKKSDSSLSANDRGNLKGMRDDIEEFEDKIFSGKEVLNMRKALYLGIENMNDPIPRKEVELKQWERDKLVSWNPYGNYITEKLKFVGDKILN
jgi:hypothetical protein